LKEKTDESLALLAEIKKMTINIDELTPRELKTFEQVGSIPARDLELLLPQLFLAGVEKIGEHASTARRKC
jgi:hypothetical protein